VEKLRKIMSLEGILKTRDPRSAIRELRIAMNDWVELGPRRRYKLEDVSFDLRERVFELTATREFLGWGIVNTIEIRLRKVNGEWEVSLKEKMEICIYIYPLGYVEAGEANLEEYSLLPYLKEILVKPYPSGAPQTYQ